MVGLNYDTVEAYITALEQSFVIFRLMPYSGNLRNSIRKSRKVYFWDTGIRNALINNFNPLNTRTDAGALFENFFISEMLKNKINQGQRINSYFWRSLENKEIDLIIETGQTREYFECKLNSPSSKREIEGISAEIVTLDNYVDKLK